MYSGLNKLVVSSFVIISITSKILPELRLSNISESSFQSSVQLPLLLSTGGGNRQCYPCDSRG